MKIFTAEQIRQADSFTIMNEPVSSYDLMERAALQCFNWIVKHFDEQLHFDIICGTGNNGGDGLAIARMLLQASYSVKVFVINNHSDLSQKTEENLKRLNLLAPGCIQKVSAAEDLPNLLNNSIVIDALMGTGISRSLEGVYAEVVEWINKTKNKVISIDLPSGLSPDHLPAGQSVVRAFTTLSFQFYKRSFLHPESKIYTGRIHILDIRLSPVFIHNTPSPNHTIDEEWCGQHLKRRAQDSHKGNYGHAAIVAGSYGMMGAAVLSTQSALKSGCGLVTAVIPQSGNNIMQISNPEAMTIDAGENAIERIPDLEQITVWGIGPGMSKSPYTAQALKTFLKSQNKPVVLDADALNILSQDNNGIDLIPKNSVLTPHPKEFSRLFPNNCQNSLELVEVAREIAVKKQFTIVLKNNHTAVLLPDGNCWYNITGNAGMAKGGSGDVLTGLLTSLIAQGYESAIAARLAVYIHGRAGDLAAERESQESMTATDIIRSLGKVFLLLH